MVGRSQIDKLNKRLPSYGTASSDERGNLRIHYRRASGAPKLRLRAPFDTEEFWKEYAEARSWTKCSLQWRRKQKGLSPAAPERPRSTTERTLRWLVEQYYGEYRSLKNARPRQLVLEAMLNELIHADDSASPKVADLRLCDLDDRDVRALRNRKARWVVKKDPLTGADREFRIGTEAANSRLKALRAVFGFGFINQRDVVTDKWAHKVELFQPSAAGFHRWTRAEIECFRTFYPEGTKERLAFELLFWTGQRRGDIRTLPSERSP